MKKRIALPMVLSLIVSAMAAGFISAAGEKVDLKLNLTEGKTYRTRLVNDQKMKTNMMGREMEMTNQQTMDMAMAVQSVAGGLATVAITFERIASTMQSPQGTMSFDSAKPDESQGPMAKMYGAMAGSGYTVVADQRGEVQEVRGTQEMLDRLFDSIDTDDARAKEGMKASFSQMFGEEGSKSTMGQVFGMLPPGPVAVGESWTKNMTVKAMGMLSTETTYTLKSVSDGKVFVESHAVISTGEGGESMDMGPMKVRMEMNGEQSGTVEIDLDTGLVTGGSSVFKATGTQYIESPQGPMEMPIDMEVTSTWQPL